MVKRIHERIATETHELALEGSWGSRNLGSYENKMEYFPETKDSYPHIIWQYWPEGEAEDETEEMGEEQIGLTIRGGVLLDYDGVMSIPDLALDLLEANGVDCSEMRELLKD